MTLRLRTLVLGFVAMLLAGVVGGAVLVYMGFYDISAMRQHTKPVFHLLDFAMARAIDVRADAVPPGDLGEERRVRAGLAQFQRHCLQCHGAPGVAPEALAFGLTPAPANLLHAGRTWPPSEIQWVVANGVKMTGMPGWGWRLSEEEIWDLVAFVQAMPRLSPRAYAELAGSLPGTAQAAAPVPAPPQPAPDGPATRPGRVDAGRFATQQYLCATCHVIPGVVGANQHVGPPLGGIAGRAYIGGVLPNSPENMVRFLRDPQAVDPLSAMPALGLTEQDARDIAAFLFTLDKVEGK
ncbi:c-type cytochrome [Ramlibacter sp.]|uniref:c-type cytochrome n=1 Tax=Ramlibacter sp. TaxID=1917967 RepID=UPI002D446BC9|nr:c-type cytochrome [Ramlibacter sp.]HYD75792.1 c-type cytochrome [Ramlibacter sp.]